MAQTKRKGEMNRRSSHKAPTPTTAELIARLAICADGLDWQAEKAAGDYKAYFGDRAQQCRKWLEDLKAGQPVDAGYITGGLEEFEQLAL